MKSNMRKWFGLVSAIIAYYILHEGGHILMALLFGAYRGLRFVGIWGVQVMVNTAKMTDFKLAIFSSAGAIIAIFSGYLLVIFMNSIISSQSKVFKAAGYYITLALLMIDPLYLSLLYPFFGGGDMNGILRFGIPELVARGFFFTIGIANLYLIVTKVLPAYKQSFANK